MSTAVQIAVDAAFSTGSPQGVQARGAHAAVKVNLSSADAKAAGTAVQVTVSAQASVQAQFQLGQASVTLSAAASALSSAGARTGDDRLTLAGELTAQLGGVTLKVKGDLASGISLSAALTNPLGIPGLSAGITFKDGAISLQAAYNLALRSNDPALINAAPHLKLAASLAMSAATSSSATSQGVQWALQFGLSYATSVATGAISTTAQVSYSSNPATPDTRFTGSARLQLAGNLTWLGLNLDVQAKLGGPK